MTSYIQNSKGARIGLKNLILTSKSLNTGNQTSESRTSEPISVLSRADVSRQEQCAQLAVSDADTLYTLPSKSVMYHGSERINFNWRK